MRCGNFISCEAVWPSLLTETGSELANSHPQTPLSLTLSHVNWGPFLESPETLRVIFGCRSSFCISRTEKIYVVKLHSPFSFRSLKSISKRWAFQSKRLAVSQITFRARKVFGTFEKRALGPVSRKSRELFGPEKPVVKPQSAYFE